jgi:large repetitive protein
VRSALIGALILVLAACARPTSTAHQTVPTPSPSPTPTTPLALTATAPFHTGEAGVAYAPVALSATGGVQPYTWSVVAGALPDGLTIGPDGTVSGIPTSAGTFSFTVQAADSGNSTATIPGSVPIAAAPSASLIPECATQCSVELGCTSVCGDFGQLSGGVGPYSYALTSGQLPAGTSLSGLSLTGIPASLQGTGPSGRCAWATRSFVLQIPTALLRR